MRSLLPGSILNAIAGSAVRYPAFRVLVWDPAAVSIGDVAAGRPSIPPVDLSAFCERIDLSENVGFEQQDDVSTPSARFTFRALGAGGGVQFRRGMIDDGVIVRVYQGDRRVAIDDWIPIFTGTFRGRPGEDGGTRDGASSGCSATAYGREERYLNLDVTTSAFDRGTDLGTIARTVALDHMGLSIDEILFGTQAVVTWHQTNQIVEENALSALWHLLFPSGKKPRFDALGRLCAIDSRFDKAPARIMSAGDHCVVSRIATPNDVEVYNSVVMRGLSATLSKALQDEQLITTLSAVTGFFDSDYKKDVWYSEDRTQRVQNTRLVTKKKIWWSHGDWSESDEFHGRVEIDTRYLRNARIIILVNWIASQISVAVVDYYFQSGGVVANLANWFTLNSAANYRLIAQISSMASLALLLWSMQFIGRGEYEVWGRPYEYVYQELVTRHQVEGLAPEEVREVEYRNDFLSDMEDLDAAAFERLKREVVKNQVYEIVLLDDPALEVDDVIQIANGDRYYITSISRTLAREGAPTMHVTAWKIVDGALVALLGTAA